jgi:amino-acid N-acetyltransferase
LQAKAAVLPVQAAANFQIMQIERGDNYKESIIELLAAEKLPVADLPSSLENFLVALQNKEFIGVAGLEIYGHYGLLRSLTVKADYRGQGIADKLLQRIAALSSLNQVSELYLLTETAPDYFEKKGYRKITRADVPVELQ